MMFQIEKGFHPNPSDHLSSTNYLREQDLRHVPGDLPANFQCSDLEIQAISLAKAMKRDTQLLSAYTTRHSYIEYERHK